MKISRVWAVYFSPTGNVKEVTNLIAKKLSEELSVPLEQWDFTLPDNRKSAKAFEKEDLVVFGTPVYAGRVPIRYYHGCSRDLQEIIHLWYQWLFLETAILTMP